MFYVGWFVAFLAGPAPVPKSQYGTQVDDEIMHLYYLHPNLQVYWILLRIGKFGGKYQEEKKRREEQKINLPAAVRVCV